MKRPKKKRRPLRTAWHVNVSNLQYKLFCCGCCYMYRCQNNRFLHPFSCLASRPSQRILYKTFSEVFRYLLWNISCHCWHHKQDGLRYFPRYFVSLLGEAIVHLVRKVIFNRIKLIKPFTINIKIMVHITILQVKYTVGNNYI